jgi:hypothetical protein
LHPQRIPAQSESFPERSATRGYFQVPNSLAENQALLTPAEKAIFLIACRIGAGRTISDEHWTKWTGLEPRIKRFAIKGCQEKGLRVSGRGDGAKFFFDRDAWDSWVKRQPRHHRARTIGRKESVTPKAGQQIHPECRERGCQKLCEPQNGVIAITSSPASPNWQPVANSSPPKIPPETSLTLAAIQKRYPHADAAFERKLRSAVEQRVKVQYSDAELAQAVQVAHKRNQESEGLFLHTVPARLAHIVAQRDTARPKAQQTSTPEQVADILDSHASKLSKADMKDLAQQVRSAQTEDREALENQLLEIEAKVIERLRMRTSVDVFKAAVEAELKPYRAKMSPEQLERLRQQFIERKLLEDAGLTRISLYL